MSLRTTVAAWLLAAAVPAAAADTEALEAARSVARWLETRERPGRAGGLSWPVSDLDGGARTGIDAGAAGIGTFYLRLYRATGEAAHLDRARRAADFIAAEYEAGRVNGPDWLAGAAGGGTFFMELYRATGDPAALARAESTARALMRTAYGDPATGVHWRHSPDFPRVYTGVAHGAAGIALFLLEVHEATRHPDYLAYAEGAYRWMAGHQVALEEGIGWKRLTTDPHAYHLWCGGSAGIVKLLARLLAVTGREEYRTALRRTADGLLRAARTTGDGHLWGYTSARDLSQPLAFCHGTISVAVALLVAHEALGDPRYLDAARGGVRWTIAARGRATAQGGGLWEHLRGSGRYETGYFTGTASIGRGLIQAWRRDPAAASLEAARAALRGLLEVADRPAAGQLRWTEYVAGSVGEERRAFATGVYSGAAGVGLFLLDLHAAEKGTEHETW